MAAVDAPFDQRLARWISLAFHPFVIVAPTLLVGLSLDTGSVLEAVRWTAFSAAFVVLPSALYLRRKLLRGEYSDAELSVRQERYGIYALGLVLLIACAILLQRFGAPAILTAGVWAAVLASAVANVINRFWKISGHMGAVGGSTAFLAWVSAPLGAVLALASVLVAWARLRREQHSYAQLAAGWAVGAGAFLVLVLLRGSS